MLNLIQYKQFEKDIKRAKRRGKNLDKLKKLILLLANEKVLPKHYQDHLLKGNWKECRDAHIEPDWLLIYKKLNNELHLVRTGSHSDLFK